MLRCDARKVRKLPDGAEAAGGAEQFGEPHPTKAFPERQDIEVEVFELAHVPAGHGRLGEPAHLALEARGKMLGLEKVSGEQDHRIERLATRLARGHKTL